jgi:hypothetical protein
MKSKVYITLIGTLVLMLSACSPQKQNAGNYNYKTECLGVEMDGSQTVKAWGSGKNRSLALEQAKKNAVRDVLFNGIIEGKSDCEKRPVVPEVNAQLKYEPYFNKFFADGGEYKNFVSMKDEQIGSRDVKGARESITVGAVIRVLRNELKQKMTADGILK